MTIQATKLALNDPREYGKTMFWMFAPIVLLLLVGVWIIAVYNRFVTFRERIDEAWSDIDVQLKRRYELIPNLVNTIKGYTTHEQDVFQKVTDARARAMGASDPAEHARAEDTLTGTLKSLFAVAESYPSLKANTNFLELQRELSDTENKIQASRRFYNGTVRDFNTSIQMFPARIIAATFGFRERVFFEVSGAEERTLPNVDFSK